MARCDPTIPAALVVALSGASCGSWQPPPVEPFYAGNLATAESIFRQRQEEAAGDWILMTNELATCLEAQGRTEEAWHLYFDAGRAMDYYTTTFGESTGAIVGREETKEYKGDPYEQCFNSIYAGLAAFVRGEPDNARASFKEAMLRDADSEEERFKSDLALSFYLAAWASRDMGLPQDAVDFLAEARTARRSAVKNGARGKADPGCLAAFAEANVLFVASLGRGPEKARGGRYGELAVLVAQDGESAAAAQITVDGRSLGRSELLADVFFQASTRGGRWMDGVRAGKVVFKDLTKKAGAVLTGYGVTRSDHREGLGFVLAGVGALLLSGAVRPEVDIRCWRTLPDTVQIKAARLAPGRRQVLVEFLSPGGAVMPEYRRREWIDVPEEGTLVLHLRGLPVSPALAGREPRTSSDQLDPK